MEGSLFLVKRRTQPRFQFIILNKKSAGVWCLRWHLPLLFLATQAWESPKLLVHHLLAQAALPW